MTDRPQRLGDVVDDYCPRCRLLLNHDVASLYGGVVAKVTCRTCHNTHDYRHAEVPTRRKKAPGGVDKAKLMDEVLAGMGRVPTTAPAPVPAPAADAPSVPEPASPAAPPGPGPRRRRDLWADLERIRQKK